MDINKTNKIFFTILFLIIAGIFSCQDPSSPVTSFTVTVSGQVLNLNGTPQDSVQLILFNPFRNTDTTKGDGTFHYTFTSEENNEIATTLRFHHINKSFLDTTVSVTYSINKKSIAIGEMKMTNVIDTTTPSKPPVRAKAIKFISSSLKTISIRGAGEDVTNLIFEVRDSLGIPVDIKNSVSVSFVIVTKPDSLVELNHSSATTNSNGQVIVQLFSGVKAGQAQVQAIALVKNAVDTSKIDSIKSEIVTIVVAGGLPVGSRFTIGSDKVNVPGLFKFGMRNIITAIVGDTFGNPVRQGTIVSFTTTGGVIQSSASTSVDGVVSVDLITGNPFPTNGLAVITAQVGSSGSGLSKIIANDNTTFDEAVIIKGLRGQQKSKLSPRTKYTKTTLSASTFFKTINVLFSGEPRISSNDSVFVVSPLGVKQIQFTVDDINGNPLSQGTTIKVAGVGLDTSGAELAGDINNTLPDTYDKSYTKFNISITDKRIKNLEKSIPIILNIEVTGPNGNIKRTLNGLLASSTIDSGKIGSITMVNSFVDTIAVNGAGTPTSSLVQVKVLDISNKPVVNIPVTFAFTKTVGGGEYLSALSGTTDASGIATVTFNSGIRSGLVQLRATVKNNETSINSDIKSIYVKTGAIVSLNLVSASSTSLSVKGGGGVEGSVLIFEAKDSLGNTIDALNQASITMSLQGDTAGARVNPSIVKTDPNTGRVAVYVTAGTQSGVIIVTAKSGSVSSSAIQIAVSGGLPAQSQFTLSLPKKNFSTITDKLTTVSVTAGDALGNPAISGTLINFKSNGGLIDASSTTNSSGVASASLQIVNPQPPSGIATIEAKTFSINGIVVRDTQTVVFSREAIITEIGGPYTNFEIEDGLSKTFQYSIADINGNPLAQGNSITVQALGSGSTNIALTGDINVTTTDAKVQGIGTTQFSFNAIDLVKGEGQGLKPLSFKISVVGPNTSGIVSWTMSGTLKGGASADQNHFTMSTPSYNFPGLDLAFTTRNVTIQVGDEFGHPVVDGTIVYFNSAHGTMAKDSLTSVAGFVSNTLYSANPFPQGQDTLNPDAEILNYYPSTKGFSRVYAKTFGKNGQWVTDSLLFLWTGKPVITNTGVDTFTVTNGGVSSPLTFKIVDRFGHPMSAGTTITVTASTGNIFGDASRIIPDTFIGGAGFTTFSVFLADAAPTDTAPPQWSDIIVTVNHPVYGVIQFPLARGTID
ncbi:MAG: Ig-like domain-containing protein [Bacteroidota bacterium]|nr:Ig-like domain-containing protein [Bacteroidota bacterium]